MLKVLLFGNKLRPLIPLHHYLLHHTGNTVKRTFIPLHLYPLPLTLYPLPFTLYPLPITPLHHYAIIPYPLPILERVKHLVICVYTFIV